jgi:NTP pyrophosphatase (non-canonical NTP hydrolase)
MRQEALVDVTALAERLRAFARERSWEQFHSPKNLAMALTGEVGELVEIFQWMTEAESTGAGADPRTRSRVREELADVLLYLVRLADVLQVDLNSAVIDKLAVNAARYPVDRSHGSSAKYTELEE